MHSYNALQLCAALIRLDYPKASPCLLLSDWKKDVWHALQIEDTMSHGVQACDTANLASYEGSRFHLPQRKGWQPAPKGAREVRYQPERLPEVWARSGLLSATDSVKLFNAGANRFQKWSAQRHRAQQPE